MQAGRLRHRVTIQNFITTELPSGQELEQWQNTASVWGEVKDISGRELIGAGAELPEATTRIWIRYRSDVSSASRILFRGLVYAIAAPPMADAKFTRLEILCKQGVEQ